MIKGKYLTVIVHVLTWSIVLLFPYFISTSGNQYKIGPLPGLYFTLSGLIHAIIFYTNAFVLYPKLLNKTYWWLYIFSIVLLIALSVWVKFYIVERWFPDDLSDVRSHMLFPSVIVFIVSVFYSIMVDKTRTEKLQKENEALQLDMQLKLLRNQISPHFLFNVLTNLVSLARKKSGNLETSLLMLSGLMRYMLYDAEKKLPIQQEVEYLQSYVALQKLRMERDAKIEFSIGLSPAETIYNIEPMLLIPFVENAFKHGASVPGPVIEIKLTLKDGVLVFSVNNKFDSIEDTNKDESSGIGLNNVQSRLKLLYPGRHNLEIADDNHVFSIHLKLKL